MIYCTFSNQIAYPFILPSLPYDANSFLPYFSSETFEYHHGKHHQAYVTNLNNLLKDRPELLGKSLEEIIHISKDNMNSIFNNAAQVWNHTFFWHSIKPSSSQKPDGILLDYINRDFGNLENFNNAFTQAAIEQFGSGWVWLVYNDNKLQIIKTSNAQTPITENIYPLIACDVWEHAYYIDYRNKRLDYVSIYLQHMVSWQFASARLQTQL
jgi:Fe-Mn family superoxide dismutase